MTTVKFPLSIYVISYIPMESSEIKEIIENSLRKIIRNFCLHVKYCYFFNFNVAKLILPYYNILNMHNNKKHGRKTFQNCGDWLSAYIISWIFGECFVY